MRHILSNLAASVLSRSRRMRETMKYTLCILIGLAQAAQAYEYRLQFTTAGGAIRNVVVAGYAIDESTVTGVCSYDRAGTCSGRGCRSVIYHYPGTCTWDLYGNLLSRVPGAPAAQNPLYVIGTETVYASNGISSTGSDKAFGFVDTPSSHYSWQTPSGGYGSFDASQSTIPVTLVSDGDFDLSFDGASATVQSYSIYNEPGAVSVETSCTDPVLVGSPCTVVIHYEPPACTASPYGFAYIGIGLSASTDAPAGTDWSERFTIIGVPICED